MKKSFILTLIVCFSISVNTFSQSEKKTKNQESINFNETFHSLGFSIFNGINFAPKIQDIQGDIKPILLNAYVPEFILQYNMMIKNGFGFALEIPFGIFHRKSITLLSDYGASNDVLLDMGSQYIGFTGKLTVFKELSSNVCMQGELGIKFNPFYFPANQWYNIDYYSVDELYVFEDNSSINFPTIKQKYYAIPDATAGLQFFFHSKKKPRSNLVIGLNVNLSFVKRIKIIYDTRFSELSFIESPYYGHGNYGWKSSAIGISIGYRFFGVK
jgi:hypothetical protein